MFKQSVFFSLWTVIRVLPVTVLLTACFSNSDSSDSEQNQITSAAASGVPSFAEGYVIKGPVANSVVTIFKINNDATRGPLAAGPFLTDETGYWSGSVPHSDMPYEVVSYGGSYTDEASGLDVVRLPSSDKDSLSGILDFEHSRLSLVTPYTSAALLAAKHRSTRDRVEIEVAIREVIFDMELAFGFDLSTVVPSFVADSTNEGITAEQSYAALLGGFSALLDNNPDLSAVNTASTYDLRSALISDLADGHLDGRNVNGNPVRVTLANGSFANFSALSSGGISALISAINRYALSQTHLAQIAMDNQTVLAFNSEGGRLLSEGVNVEVEGEGYFMFTTQEGPIYKRKALLRFDDSHTIVDEQGNQLVIFHADINGLATTASGKLKVNSQRYFLHSIEIDSKGRIKVKRTDGVAGSLGQVVLVKFADPDALSEVSPGQWSQTEASGTPQLSAPGRGATGVISLLGSGLN